MSLLALAGHVSLGVCLQLVAAPESTPVFVPTQEFTLAWNHSIEKVRWEEDYVIQLDAKQQPALIALAARIKGSAAGMEPPEGAILKAGWYHYKPLVEEHPQLYLTRSEFVPDYEWCDEHGCRSLADFLSSDGGVTLMWACTEETNLIDRES